MTVALVYDRSERDARHRHGLLAPAVAQLDGWKLEAYTSRIELLDRVGAIEAARSTSGSLHRRAVVLADLAANDADLRYVGFELIETLSRHPELRAASARVVVSRHFDGEIVEHAQAVGAHAVIDLDWLESSSADEIAEALQTIAMRPATAESVAPYSTRDQQTVAELLEPLRVALEEAGIVGNGVGWNGTNTLVALIALAEGMPRELVPSWLLGHFDKLRSRLDEAMFNYGTKPEIAREYLLRYAPPLPRPIHVTWLPSLAKVDDWMKDSEVHRGSWLPAAELKWLTQALARRARPALPGSGGPRPANNVRLQQDEYASLVDEAVAVDGLYGRDRSREEVDAALRRMLFTLKLTARELHELRVRDRLRQPG